MSDEEVPEVGTLALDTKTGWVGQVMGREDPYVQLRQPQGGVEWDARPEDVRPAGTYEHLRARVAEANAHSGGVR